MKEVEESVIDDILARRGAARAAYGATMERGDLGTRAFLQRAYEEALDLAIYLRRAIRDMGGDEFTIHQQDGGFAVVRETGEHGGIGSIRFAKTMEEALLLRGEMIKSSGS